jgi:hypothetical protein
MLWMHMLNDAIRNNEREKMLKGARSLHMQAVQQKARHNGQDEADLKDEQSNYEEAVFPLSISTGFWCSVTLLVHSGMTVMELTEMYQVCSHACEAVVCIFLCLTPETQLNVQPPWASNASI